jgi:hypothetical protein
VTVISESERIETEIANIWMGDDGIVYIHFKPTDHHGIADAKLVVDAHNRLAAGQPCPVLADIQEVKLGANREARAHYVSEESSRYKSGMAMVVSSPMQRMLGNLFFRLNRPPYPTRLFTERDEARAWLKALAS